MSIFSVFKKRKLLKSIESEPQQFQHYIDLFPLLIEDREYDEALKILETGLRRQWSDKETTWLTFSRFRIHTMRGSIDHSHTLQALELTQSTHLSIADRIEAAKSAFSLFSADSESESIPDDLITNYCQSTRELFFKALEIEDISASVVLLGALIHFYETQGRSAEAFVLIESAMERLERSRFKDKSSIYLKAAEIAEALGKDNSVIRGFLNKAISSGELDEVHLIPVLEKNGQLLHQSEDLLGAMEKYEQALRLISSKNTLPEARIRFNLARVYFDLGRVPQALKESDSALKISGLPSEMISDIESWLTDANIARGLHEDALVHARRALEHVKIESKRVKLLRQSASLSMILGDPASAIEALLKALNHVSDQDDTRVQLDLAHAYSENQESHKALKILHNLQKSDSIPETESPEILKEIGFAYERQLKIVKAIETYLGLLESVPDGHSIGSDVLTHLRGLKKTLSHPESLKNYKMDGGDRKTLATLLDRIPAEDDFFLRLKKGLLKTKTSLIGGIEKILSGRTSIDEAVIEEIEELLILSDLGVETTRRIIDGLYDRFRKSQLKDASAVKGFIREQIEGILDVSAGSIDPSIPDRPYVIMVVGVNGVGKTTTIAKIAKRFTDQGRSVMLAAGDTFRAGAIEQLQEWGRRLEVEVISQKEGSDPSAVAWDAVAAAKTRDVDILIIDTAGRLHTKTNLMEELKKVSRVIDKNIPGAPHETLLVLDATTGQNAVIQAKQFCEAAGVTGIVLTKLDGTAKGGIIIGIVEAMRLPVKLIGIGERMDDLKDFDPRAFAAALFEE